MSKILDLKAKRASAWEEAKKFLDAHEGGTMSGADLEKYEKMETDISNMGREIEALERAEAFEAKMKQPTSNPITNAPTTGPAEDKTGRASAAYKNAMLTAFRTKFRNISNVLEEGNDANGGYLVPEEYDSRLIDVMGEENIMRSLGTTITTSGEHKINIAGTKPAAAWIDEGGSIQFSDATFGQKALDAHKLHVAVKVTEELLYDSAFNLESYLINQFGKAFANAEEDAFLNGDGTGKPLGLFAATGGGTLTDTVTAIKCDDVISLIYALGRPYRKNASFIMKDKTIAAIRKLKDNNGQYLWQPSHQAGEPDTIFGYKVNTSAYAPEDAIAFGDYSYYNIGDRGVRSFAALTELFAGNGMVGFLAKERVDGKLLLPEAVQILKIGSRSS